MVLSKSFSVGTNSLPPKPTAYALGTVGLILLAATAYLVKSSYDLQQNGIHTQAKVVQLERSNTTYFPVFRFQDQKGRELTVRSSVSSKDYFVGDAIPIVYDPRRPLDAEVDDPYMLYFGAGVVGFLGGMFLLGMFFVLKALPFFEEAYDAQRGRHNSG